MMSCSTHVDSMQQSTVYFITNATCPKTALWEHDAARINKLCHKFTKTKRLLNDA